MHQTVAYLQAMGEPNILILLVYFHSSSPSKSKASAFSLTDIFTLLLSSHEKIIIATLLLYGGYTQTFSCACNATNCIACAQKKLHCGALPLEQYSLFSMVEVNLL